MARPSDNTKPKKNPTEERLRATPFENVQALEKEQHLIRLQVWRRFHEAQVINELMTKPESAFMVEEWREGLVAYFGEGDGDRLFRIYSDGRGLKFELNRNYTQTLGENEARFVEGLARACIEGYGTLYFRAKSLLRDAQTTLEEPTPRE
jgi:hypothetical protein